MTTLQQLTVDVFSEGVTYHKIFWPFRKDRDVILGWASFTMAICQSRPHPETLSDWELANLNDIACEMFDDEEYMSLVDAGGG